MVIFISGFGMNLLLLFISKMSKNDKVSIFSSS